MKKWLKRFESRHPLINMYALISSFNRGSLGAQNRNILILSKGTNVTFYRLESENETLKEVWLEELLDYKKMEENIARSESVIVSMDNVIKEATIFNKDRDSLFSVYSKYVEAFRDIFVCYDMTQPEVTYTAEFYLKRLIGDILSDKKIEQNVFLKITLPSNLSALSQEELDWATLLKKAYNSKGDAGWSTEILNLVEQQSEKYSWISTQENQPPNDYQFYLKKLNDEIESANLKDLDMKIGKLKTQPFTIDKERKEALGKVGYNKEIETLSEFLRQLGMLRIDLRLAWTKGAYYTKPVFSKLAGELSINEDELKYLLPEEVEKYLFKNRKIQGEVIKKRQIGYIMLLEEGEFNLITDNIDEYISKNHLAEVISLKQKIIEGTTANSGYAKGSVKIIHSHLESQSEEVSKMQKGQILVAGSTKPQLIEACRKAAAIVTDEGGMLSHAAIVSRELGIPCVVGTKIATKILKDGDIIEVEASNGRIIINS